MFNLLIELLELTPGVSTLIEMAYSREEARKKILGISDRVCEQFILLKHCEDAVPRTHWKTEFSAFIGTVYKATKLTSGGRLKLRDLQQWAWNAPMGEYSDYIRYYRALTKEKQDVVFTDPSESAYNAIHQKCMNAFDIILVQKRQPEYDEL